MGPNAKLGLRGRRDAILAKACERQDPGEELKGWTWNEKSEPAYTFCLDARNHGEVYFRTFSKYVGPARHGRDVRAASTVDRKRFEQALETLGQPHQFVSALSELRRWSIEYGWGIVDVSFCEQHLKAFLIERECLASATGLYWDVDLPRNRAPAHRTSHLRDEVLARDGYRCVQCHKTKDDGVTLTLDHVIPFSRGGETTIGNLVTLCQQCNNFHGDSPHPQLFVLAGLHHGWDPRLLSSSQFKCHDAYRSAISISGNIMVSRCKIGDVPEVALNPH